MTLYVSNIMVASNDLEIIAATKGWLTSNFDMTNMSDASHVLEVKIYRNQSKRVLGLSQEMYLKNVLERFKIHNSKPISTPIEKIHYLSLQDCQMPKEPQ